MDSELKTILDEARAQIARGGEPDVEALEARVRAVDPLKDAVAPAGTPLTLSATVAVKPPDGVIVTV